VSGWSWHSNHAKGRHERLVQNRADQGAEALIAAQLQQLSYDITHLTETSEKLATGVVNHVLEAGTRVVDATGGFTLSFGATAGAGPDP
jgi:hypothetical protein